MENETGGLGLGRERSPAAKMADSLWFAYSLLVVGISGLVGVILVVWGFASANSIMLLIGTVLLGLTLVGLFVLWVVATWWLVSGLVRLALNIVLGRKTTE